MLNVFNARGFPQLLSITNTKDNFEAIFKLIDFYAPISSLYTRTQILGETDQLSITENSVIYEIRKDCIKILKDNIVYFKFESKQVLTSLVDTLNNTTYVELLKVGDFSNFRSKKNINQFFDQILAYFFEKKLNLSTFCWLLKKAVLDEKNVDPKCALHKIYIRFARNIVDAGSFEQMYKVLVCKIIACITSSKHEQNIEIFIKNYSLD